MREPVQSFFKLLFFALPCLHIFSCFSGYIKSLAELARIFLKQGELTRLFLQAMPLIKKFFLKRLYLQGFFSEICPCLQKLIILDLQCQSLIRLSAAFKITQLFVYLIALYYLFLYFLLLFSQVLRAGIESLGVFCILLKVLPEAPQ